MFLGKSVHVVTKLIKFSINMYVISTANVVLQIFRFSMDLAMNILHGRGPNNKMNSWLQPKKTKVRLH